LGVTDLRSDDRKAAERLVNVSRETWVRFERLVAALDRWQPAINLVAPATLPQIWTRHVADSAQLVALAPARPRSWVDLGSGGGFPGLVIAAIVAADCEVHLVESTAKKAAFLREAARAMGVTVTVHAARVEPVAANLRADVVSARALAPLADLLRLAEPLLKTGASGLFPKGREAAAELTEARKCWRFSASLHPSLTDPEARIVRIDRFEGRP
jgi:16S rRNA (guanine527-N7)-methyltransferase